MHIDWVTREKNGLSSVEIFSCFFLVFLCWDIFLGDKPFCFESIGDRKKSKKKKVYNPQVGSLMLNEVIEHWVCDTSGKGIADNLQRYTGTN